MKSKCINLFKIIPVFILAVPLHAVTVNPALCPTNKIAPHRRISSWGDDYQPRTFGAFYDLLTPQGAGQPYGPLNSLQEEPQKDDPDDCGDIADYDENDLSSITPQSQRRYGYGRLFFSNFNNGGGPPQGYPVRPNRPMRPQRPGYPPTKPPYSSGGFFGNNVYRPPALQYPSDYIKPVHEGVQEPQTTYRPGVVGGPIGHVVGVNPVRPVRPPVTDPVPQRLPYDQFAGANPVRHPRPPVTESTNRIPSYVQFPSRPTEAPVTYPTRRPRPRSLNNDSVIGSFFNLLFK